MPTKDGVNDATLRETMSKLQALIRPMMANPIAPELTEENARWYIGNPDVHKRGVLIWDPCDYNVMFPLEAMGRGNQSFDGPHVRIDGKYGCALREFFNTHKPVKERESVYYKDERVLAMQVDEPTDVITIIDGKEESRTTANPGDWIVQNPGGEQYSVPNEKFQKRYIRECDDKMFKALEPHLREGVTLLGRTKRGNDG